MFVGMKSLENKILSSFTHPFFHSKTVWHNLFCGTRLVHVSYDSFLWRTGQNHWVEHWIS